MRLPAAFANKFRDEIGEACQVTVPTGETHQVALVEKDNNLCFRHGWEQFMDRFSIGYGHLMMFTYLGNFDLKVKVFNLTACEISYSNKPSAGDLSPALSEEELDGDGEEYDHKKNVVVDDLHSHSHSHSLQRPAVEVVELDSEDDEMRSDESSESVAVIGEPSYESQLEEFAKANYEELCTSRVAMYK